MRHISALALLGWIMNVSLMAANLFVFLGHWYSQLNRSSQPQSKPVDPPKSKAENDQAVQKEKVSQRTVQSHISDKNAFI